MKNLKLKKKKKNSSNSFEKENLAILMSRLPVKEEQQRLHVIQLVVADQSHQVAAHGLPILLFRDVGGLEPLFQHHPHIRQISGSAQ